MQGAGTVNDEFEVGFDQRFESRWHRAELVGRVVMTGVVVVAALGFLGRGPFSHETVRSADHRIAVDYEPVARHSTTTTITVHVPNDTGAVRPVRIQLDQHIIEPMGLQHITPPANASSVADDGIIADFTVEPRQPDTLVRFSLSPTAVGLIPVHLKVGDEQVNWTMMVMP